MSDKQYNLAVVIGRFEPLHDGHTDLIQRALVVADHVVVIIGSGYQARTIKNPFTVSERAQMINEEFPTVKVEAIRDYIYDNALWESQIHAIVDKCAVNGKVVLVGHEKDRSSSYLKWFPQWSFESVDLIRDVDATSLRDCLFDVRSDVKMRLDYISSKVPKSTLNRLEFFINTPEFKNLCDEYASIQAYKKIWETAPYKPTFVTTDAVVTCAGHVLMVKRKASPGRGLLALPGGFLNQEEFVADGIIRELIEETEINLGYHVLKGNLKEIKVFDHPNRSLRGRTITHAGLIPLLFKQLPKVNGADDAEYAYWIPYGNLEPLSDMIFEDHLSIIQNMVRI